MCKGESFHLSMKMVLRESELIIYHLPQTLFRMKGRGVSKITGIKNRSVTGKLAYVIISIIGSWIGKYERRSP